MENRLEHYKKKALIYKELRKKDRYYQIEMEKYIDNRFKNMVVLKETLPELLQDMEKYYGDGVNRNKICKQIKEIAEQVGENAEGKNAEYRKIDKHLLKQYVYSYIVGKEEENEFRFKEDDALAMDDLDDTMFDQLKMLLDQLEEDIIINRVYEETKDIYVQILDGNEVNKITNEDEYNKNIERLIQEKKAEFEKIVGAMKQLYWGNYLSPQLYDKLRHLFNIQETEVQSQGILLYLEVIERFILRLLAERCNSRINTQTGTHLVNWYGPALKVQFPDYIEENKKQMQMYIAEEIKSLGKDGKQYKGIESFLKTIEGILGQERYELNEDYSIDRYERVYDNILDILSDTDNRSYTMNKGIRIYDNKESGSWKTRRRNYLITLGDVLELIYIHMKITELKQDYFFINQQKIKEVIDWESVNSNNLKLKIEDIYESYDTCMAYQAQLLYDEIEDWQVLWLGYIDRLKKKYDEIATYYTVQNIDVKSFDKLIHTIKDERISRKVEEAEHKFLESGKIEKTYLDKLMEEIMRYCTQMEKGEETKGEIVEIKTLIGDIIKRKYEDTVNHNTIAELTKEEKHKIYDAQLYCVMKLMKNLLTQKAKEEAYD